MLPSQYFREAAIRRSSYYDRDYRASRALNRARRPYLLRNAFTGLGVFGFAIAVYVYTIKAIGEDNFDDVVPANHAQLAQSQAESTSRSST